MHILGSLVLILILVYNYSAVYCYKGDYDHYSGEEPYRIHDSDSSGSSGDTYGDHPRKAWKVAFGKLWKKSQPSLPDEENFEYDHHHIKREVHLPKMHDDYGNDEEYANCPHEFDVGIWNPGSLGSHGHHPDEHKFNDGNGWKRWHTQIHKHLPKIEDDYGNAEEYAKCPHEYDVGIWNPGSLNGHRHHPSEHSFNDKNGWKRQMHVHDELRKMEDFGNKEEYADCPHEYGIGLWNPGTMGPHHGHPSHHHQYGGMGDWKREIHDHDELQGSHHGHSNHHHEDGGVGGGGSFYDKRDIHENLVVKKPASKRKSSIHHQIAGSMNRQPHNSLEQNIKCYHQIMRRLCQRRSKCRPRSPAGYWELNGMHDPVRHVHHEGGHYPEHRGAGKRYRCHQPIVLRIHGATAFRSNVSSEHSLHNKSRRSNVSANEYEGIEPAAGGAAGASVVAFQTLPKGRWIPEPNEETPQQQTQEDAHSVDDSDFLDDGEPKFSYEGLNRNGTIKTYEEFDNSRKNLSQTEPGNFFVGNGSTNSEQSNSYQDTDPEGYGDYDDDADVEGGENSKLPHRFPTGLKTSNSKSSRIKGHVDSESPHDVSESRPIKENADGEPPLFDVKSTQAKEKVGEKSPVGKEHVGDESPQNVEGESSSVDGKSPQARENDGGKSPHVKAHVHSGSSKGKENVDGESPKVKENVDRKSPKVKGNIDGESPEVKEKVDDAFPDAKEIVDNNASPLVQLNVVGTCRSCLDNVEGKSPHVEEKVDGESTLKDNVNGHDGHPNNKSVVEVDDVNREILRNASEVDVTIKKEQISTSSDKGKKSLKNGTDDDSRRTDIVMDTPYEDEEDGEGEDSKMPMHFPVGMWKPGSKTPDDYDYGDSDNKGDNGHDDDHKPFHESHDDDRPIHDEHSDHRPFHDDRDDRPYADERRPSHDNFDDHRPYHDDHNERPYDNERPSHGDSDDHQPYHDDRDERPYDEERPCNEERACNDKRPYDEERPSNDKRPYDEERPSNDKRPYDEERPSHDNYDEPRPYHNSRDEGQQYHDRGYNRTIRSKRKSMIQRQKVDGTIYKYSRAVANFKSFSDSVGDSTRRQSTHIHSKKKRHYIRGKPKSIIPDDRNISGNASRRSWFHPMRFEGSLLDKFKKHWAELENGGGNDDKEEESFDTKKKDKSSVHRPRLKVMKSINHNMPEITAKRVSRRHHRKHIDTKFSSRDKEAGEVPEEIMRTLNFPKKIYPGEASLPEISTSGDDPSEYSFDDKTAAGSGGNSALASDKVLTGSKKLTKDKIYDSMKRVFPLDSGQGNGKESSKHSIVNQERKRRHKHRPSTSERRRLHDYNDNDYDNEDVRSQKDDGDDDEDEDKDDMERNIERKEKEIQRERLRNYKNRHEMDDDDDGKSERKSGTDYDDDIREMEEKEQKNTKHLHHSNKKRMRDHEDHYNIDNDDDDDGDDDNKRRYHEGNYRFKPYHGLQVPHHGVERFGRKNEEIIINDASREGDVDQLDVESRLSEGSNNLPNQDIMENEKLSDLDRSFSPVSSYSKDRGRSDEGLRHMYGMDKSERDEDTPLRSHHRKMVEDSEENEERLPEESHKRYHEKEDRYDDKDDDDRDDEDDLKEKLYRELKEREQAMREHEESDFQDDDREGNEEEDEIPEREKSYDEPSPRKHYDDDEENYAEDEGKKRYHLNRLTALPPKARSPNLRQKLGSQDTKEFSVLHAESLLDHLQDEALANQKKLNFQQTSGQITNKGMLSLAYTNGNNGGDKQKHTKMKRHELFLAPHRRNFNSKKTNDTYNTIAHFLDGATNVLTKPVKDESGKIRSVPESDNSTQITRRQLVFQTFFASKAKEPRSIIRTYRIYSKRQAGNAEPIFSTTPLKTGRKSLTLIDNSSITLDASASRDFDPDELGT